MSKCPYCKKHENPDAPHLNRCAAEQKAKRSKAAAKARRAKPIEKPIYSLARADDFGRVLRVKLPGTEEPIYCSGDWYGDNPSFQLIISGSNVDDAEVKVRFNPDGTLHSLYVAEGVVVERERPEQSAWDAERYKTNEEQ